MGKEFIYYSKNEHNGLGMTAVKSSYGFWYAGNLLSPKDIAYGILNNGLMEKEGSELVEKILGFELKNKAEFTFYDIGANTGYFGVLASFLGKGKVITYAFEPLKEYNVVENETIRLNRLEGICSVFSVALDSKPGYADFFLAGTGSTLDPSFLGKGQYGKRQVEKVVLDQYIQTQKLKVPDFLKIDVEGLEYGVLSGSAATLKQNLPVIWYETAAYNKSRRYVNPNFLNTINLLEQLGYEIFTTTNKALQKVNGEFSQDGSHMFLALHNQKHRDLKLFLNSKNN